MNYSNGSKSVPIIGGVAALRGGLPALPVVGPLRARITRPLLGALPDIKGQFGRAWACDLEAARRARPHHAPRDALVTHLVVEAPWSSQIVHSYSLLLLHLRLMLEKAPVERYLEGATHEVHLRAINPEADRQAMLTQPINPGAWLEPVVFAAQIVEPDDAAADARVRRAAELVCEGRISPHPSHVRTWIELFNDSMTRVAAEAPAQDLTQEESGR